MGLINLLHRADKFGTIGLKAGKAVDAKFVKVRHDEFGLGQIIDRMKGRRIRPVLVHHGVRPWLAGDVIKIEPVATRAGMH